MMSIKASVSRGLAVATVVIASTIGVTAATSNTSVVESPKFKSMEQYRKDFVRPTSIPLTCPLWRDHPEGESVLMMLPS